jgi:hypothetical protein
MQGGRGVLCTSRKLHEDGLAQKVGWSGQQNLLPFVGMWVQLEFRLHRADLFSFEFSNEAAG